MALSLLGGTRSLNKHRDGFVEKIELQLGDSWMVNPNNFSWIQVKNQMETCSWRKTWQPHHRKRKMKSQLWMRKHMKKSKKLYAPILPHPRALYPIWSPEGILHDVEEVVNQGAVILMRSESPPLYRSEGIFLLGTIKNQWLDTSPSRYSESPCLKDRIGIIKKKNAALLLPETEPAAPVRGKQRKIVGPTTPSDGDSGSVCGRISISKANLDCSLLDLRSYDQTMALSVYTTLNAKPGRLLALSESGGQKLCDFNPVAIRLRSWRVTVVSSHLVHFLFALPWAVVTKRIAQIPAGPLVEEEDIVDISNEEEDAEVHPPVLEAQDPALLLKAHISPVAESSSDSKDIADLPFPPRIQTEDIPSSSTDTSILKSIKAMMVRQQAHFDHSLKKVLNQVKGTKQDMNNRLTEVKVCFGKLESTLDTWFIQGGQTIIHTINGLKSNLNVLNNVDENAKTIIIAQNVGMHYFDEQMVHYCNGITKVVIEEVRKGEIELKGNVNVTEATKQQHHTTALTGALASRLLRILNVADLLLFTVGVPTDLHIDYSIFHRLLTLTLKFLSIPTVIAPPT
ncbi:hypothetical protein KSP39_PZI007544 [Platanthera zijinensis]|uniref:Uncharacterized protein n=1 Tax=Platanthera zijinensis TaxID=2320716 RepID=A0AAP0BNC5_9ASPA